MQCCFVTETKGGEWSSPLGPTGKRKEWTHAWYLLQFGSFKIAVPDYSGIDFSSDVDDILNSK